MLVTWCQSDVNRSSLSRQGYLPYPFQRTLQVLGSDAGTVSWLCPRFLAWCPFRVLHIDSSPGSVSGCAYQKLHSPCRATRNRGRIDS